MKKKIQVLCVVLPALLGLALLVIPSGMRFTGYLLMGSAALEVMWMFLGRWAQTSKAGRWCRRIFAAGLAAVAAVLCAFEIAIISHGEADNSAIPVDAVIVLGAGVNGETPSAALWSRIQAAREYLKEHPDVPVVLSGGQGPGEEISEAEAMYRAMRNGSEAEDARYLLEERSTSTAENFAYSKELLAARGIDPDTAVLAVVTNDFHCFRTHLIARRAGLRTIDVPAELPWWWLTANYYVRESFALVKTLLFDREVTA